MTKPTLLLSTAIGLTVAVAMGTTSFAAGQHAVTASVSKVQPSKVPGSKEKLKGSVVASGYYGSTAVSGPYLLDSESVNCGGTTTCTFEMSAMVQQCSFDGAYAPNQYAIQVQVDGNYVDGGPYAGGTQTAHVCDIQNWQGIYGGLSGGIHHTVLFSAYESSAAYLAQWSDRTDVGKP